MKWVLNFDSKYLNIKRDDMRTIAGSNDVKSLKEISFIVLLMYVHSDAVNATTRL